MSQYSNFHTKRFTVLTVLIVWMLAMGIGWADACLVREHGAESPVASTSAFLANGELASLDRVGDGSHQEGAKGDGSGAGPELCNDGSDSIVKSPSSADPIFAAMLSSLAAKWVVKPAASAAVNFLPAVLAPSPHVPLRTRFSRLVL